MLLRLGIGSWPQRFELNFDRCKWLESNAVRATSGDDEAIAVTVQPKDLHHAFQRVDQPHVRDTLAGVNRQLAFAIDAFAAWRHDFAGPVRSEL